MPWCVTSHQGCGALDPEAFTTACVWVFLGPCWAALYHALYNTRLVGTTCVREDCGMAVHSVSPPLLPSLLVPHMLAVLPLTAVHVKIAFYRLQLTVSCGLQAIVW